MKGWRKQAMERIVDPIIQSREDPNTEDPQEEPLPSEKDRKR